MSKYLTFHLKGVHTWIVADVLGLIYSHGDTEKEAVEKAVSKGISIDDIAIDGVI